MFSAPKFINTESTLIGEQQEGRISISSGSTAADGEFATGLKYIEFLIATRTQIFKKLSKSMLEEIGNKKTERDITCKVGLE